MPIISDEQANNSIKEWQGEKSSIQIIKEKDPDLNDECPITYESLDEIDENEIAAVPTVIPGGLKWHCYETSALQIWVDEKKTNPMNRQSLTPGDIKSAKEVATEMAKEKLDICTKEKFINALINKDITYLNKIQIPESYLNSLGAIHLMVAKGNTESLQWLLKNGANPNQADNNGWTPLLLAMSKGNRFATQLLLKYGANPNQADNNGRTPLLLAMSKGDRFATQLLLKYGANPNQADNNGWTPLLLAMSKGDLFTAQWLLKNGANLNQVDNNGRTPLLLAMSKGNLFTAQWLLKNGANLNQADSNGWTPLLLAVIEDNLFTARLLLKNGADPDTKNPNTGRVPLHDAAEDGFTDIVKLLLLHKPNIDALDNHLDTPLLLASKYGHLDTVKLLLKHGANPYLRNQNNEAPSDFLEIQQLINKPLSQTKTKISNCLSAFFSPCFKIKKYHSVSRSAPDEPSTQIQSTKL